MVCVPLSSLIGPQLSYTNDISALLGEVGEKKITIADDVQDTFQESSFHRDLSSYLLEASADEETTPETIIAV